MAISVTSSTARNAEVQTTTAHDSIVQPFLQPDFDPADYLNSNLPSLSTTSSTSRTAPNGLSTRSVPLPELSSQLQTLLSQLNAQTTRLTNTLTQLTDEIIRSGGRLAYEVEVLRGETTGLTDTLETGLRKNIELSATPNAQQPTREEGVIVLDELEHDHSPDEPEYLQRLRNLTTVRSRLDSVIKVFDDAMQWPLPPSEMSIASSIISVTAPDESNDSRNREERGKAYIENLRNEINDLIRSDKDIEGIDAATRKVEEMRELAGVWKGTVEEKPRVELVESFSKLVEKKQKALERSDPTRRPTTSPAKAVDYRYGNVEVGRAPSDGSYGFLQNLRNLKNDMYLD